MELKDVLRLTKRSLMEVLGRTDHAAGKVALAEEALERSRRNQGINRKLKRLVSEDKKRERQRVKRYRERKKEPEDTPGEFALI